MGFKAQPPVGNLHAWVTCPGGGSLMVEPDVSWTANITTKKVNRRNDRTAITSEPADIIENLVPNKTTNNYKNRFTVTKCR